MKDEIILSLAEKWEAEADLEVQKPQDGSDDAKEHNARMAGARYQKTACAEQLRALVTLLGE